MTERSRVPDLLKAAQAVINDPDVPPLEIAEMLMDIALGVQQKPRTPDDILASISLYEQALNLVEDVSSVMGARILARRGSAWMAVPFGGVSELTSARNDLEQAITILAVEGEPEELAEANMNLGLVLHGLADLHAGSMPDAICAYQSALKTFDMERFPAEFAVLQNNIATAFLSLSAGDSSAKVREAMAVQAFEAGLKAINRIDHPREYGMLQNNLGNALQYAASNHRVENGYRALEAYDEALSVRSSHDTPSEYANTTSNKANCLSNLPDNPSCPEDGNAKNLAAALILYREALALFERVGEGDKCSVVREAIAELSNHTHEGETEPHSTVRLHSVSNSEFEIEKR